MPAVGLGGVGVVDAVRARVGAADPVGPPRPADPVVLEGTQHVTGLLLGHGVVVAGLDADLVDPYRHGVRPPEVRDLADPVERLVEDEVVAGVDDLLVDRGVGALQVAAAVVVVGSHHDRRAAVDPADHADHLVVERPDLAVVLPDRLGLRQDLERAQVRRGLVPPHEELPDLLELLLHHRVGPEVVRTPARALPVVRVDEQRDPQVRGARLLDRLVEQLQVVGVDVAGVVLVGIAAVDPVLPVAPPAQRDAHRVGARRHVVAWVLRLNRAPLPPVVPAQHDRVPGRVDDGRARHGETCRCGGRRRSDARQQQRRGRQTENHPSQLHALPLSRKRSGRYVAGRGTGRGSGFVRGSSRSRIASKPCWTSPR